MIAGVMITLLGYRAAQSTPTGPSSPTTTGPSPPTGSGPGWHPSGAAQQRPGDGLPAPEHRRHHRLPRLPVLLEAPPHLPRPHQRGLLPAARGPSGRSTRRPTWTWRTSTRTPSSGPGHIEDLSWKQLLDFATCTECGRCQSACPAWNTGKPLSPKLLIMGLRDNLFASAARLLGDNLATDDGAGEQRPRSRPTLVPGDHRPRRAVVVHDLRCVRGGVPGRHRARRYHRRHAPLRGADGVALPPRSRAHAAQHREPGRPLGSRTVQTDRVDPEPRLRDPGDHRGPSPTTSSTSTGSAAPGRSTSGPARRSRPRPACCTGPG